jgi:hypothetical protein
MIDAQVFALLAIRFLAMAIHARDQGDIVTAELVGVAIVSNREPKKSA